MINLEFLPSYFKELINLGFFFALINGLSCAVMSARMLAYSRNGAKFNRGVSVLAYLLIVASGSVAIRIAFGEYKIVDPAETLLNLVLCIAVLKARGNVAQLFYGMKSNEQL